MIRTARRIGHTHRNIGILPGNSSSRPAPHYNPDHALLRFDAEALTISDAARSPVVLGICSRTRGLPNREGMVGVAGGRGYRGSDFPSGRHSHAGFGGLGNYQPRTSAPSAVDGWNSLDSIGRFAAGCHHHSRSSLLGSRLNAQPIGLRRSPRACRSSRPRRSICGKSDETGATCRDDNSPLSWVMSTMARY